MNGIQLSLIIISWIISFFYCIHLSKKHGITWWRGLIVFVIGLFSFSFSLPFFQTTIQIAILPLGIFFLYLALRNKDSWEKYRHFAWSGFLLNYVFLFILIVSYFVSPLVYQPERLSTYIRSTEQLQLISTATDQTQILALTNDIIEQANLEILTFEKPPYEETPERFPYLLMGQQAQKGSAITSKIYIEENGKGILVDSNQKQYYFTVPSSLFEGRHSQ
ncbi:hypothetical protein MKX47_10390 [Solibacillus sp. FSL R7-0668]|uniref:hypothetical protein n=1 Tax=Solibacillus sp. FSL R7-0668 TaxID=2921688 RepID=UPI0030FC3EA3